jgi:Tfp pilus assembly protein PilO
MFASRLRNLNAEPWMVDAVGAGMLVAAGLAFYLALYAPARADVASRRERMGQLRNLMANSDEIAAEHRRLTERLDQLQQAVANTRKRMPRRSATQEFIDRATQLAESLGLEMELCTAAAPQNLATHSQVEVTCRLNGSYVSVCRYLAAVDQLSQVSKVSLLEMGAGENSRSYPVHLVFQLYYRSDLHDTEVKRGTL